MPSHTLAIQSQMIGIRGKLKRRMPLFFDVLVVLRSTFVNAFYPNSLQLRICRTARDVIKGLDRSSSLLCAGVRNPDHSDGGTVDSHGNCIWLTTSYGTGHASTSSCGLDGRLGLSHCQCTRRRCTTSPPAEKARQCPHRCDRRERSPFQSHSSTWTRRHWTSLMRPGPPIPGIIHHNES